MGKNELTMDVDECDFCHNYIEGKPVLTLEEAEEIAGRKLNPYREYYEIYYMGGTIAKDELRDIGMAIRVTDEGVMDSYGEAILMKDAVKGMIDILQEYYNRYDELYDRYVKNYRNRVIEFVKGFRRDEKKEEARTFATKDESGYIYVMLHQGYYKIGKSVDCMRLGEYTRLPEEPEYVCVVRVNHMTEMETKLHEMFKDKRCREGKCEWFSLTDGDLKVIRETLREDEVKNPEHTVGYRRYILKEDV